MSNIELNQHLSRNELVKKITTLQDNLFDCQTTKQKCEIDLQQTSRLMQSSVAPQIPAQRNILLNRIYNPLQPPERTYPNGRFYSPSYEEYQQLGFIYNDNDRFPLFGRPKYPGKTDKFEYYIIDETRNRLKIPFRSHNDNELTDGETIHIDVLNQTFNIKIYDYDSVRYNPNLPM
jgi:hypothetical protein